ncbi:hypothetical protein [Peptostreptococcus stomatis]|jgi:hypothetical protein|nr:MAG TPA: hypothetical protein [Caudoviricetes sp.]
MKKFIKSVTIFVEPDSSGTDTIMDKTIKSLYNVAENTNLIADIQVSAVMKPVTLESYTLCYSITALYYQEV